MITRFLWRLMPGLVGCAAIIAPQAAFAQPQATASASSGDTAWIIAAAALVLLMTLPGLALFYGGLVRARSFVSIVLQCAAIAAIASLVWVVAGYSFAFGAVSDGWIGGGNALFLSDMGTLRPGTTIPESAFALFQMTFAMIAPARDGRAGHGEW